MNRVKKTTINGKEFQIYLLPAGEGLRRATQLFKAFAPTFATVIDSIQDGSFDYNAVAYTIAEGLDNIDTVETVQALLRDFSVNGMSVKFDDYFLANYGELVELMAFAMEENFASFFSAKGFIEKFLPKNNVE